MATAVQTLRDRQVAALKELLNLNKPVHAAEDDGHSNGTDTHSQAAADRDEPIWKVLIFDDLGRDVISSVLRGTRRAGGFFAHAAQRRRRGRHRANECARGSQ